MGDVEVGGSTDPNKTLFVEQLPAEVNEMMLTMLFKQFRGFEEVTATTYNRETITMLSYSEYPLIFYLPFSRLDLYQAKVDWHLLSLRMRLHRGRL